MTTFPLTVISPSVAPSHGTSSPDSVTTRSSPEVISSTPCLALSTARSAGERSACSGSGSHTVMNGAVSVSPYTCVMSQPNSPSSRSMVAAAGGAPAVITRTPAGTSPRAAAGALASEISTVGAAHSQPTRSPAISEKTCAGSTLRRQTCVPPAAVTVQVNVHPLA